MDERKKMEGKWHTGWEKIKFKQLRKESGTDTGYQNEDI